MMNSTESKPASMESFPMYDEAKGFLDYENQVRKRAIMLFPVAHDHIFLSVDPVFKPPLLHKYVSVAIRIPTPDPAVARSLKTKEIAPLPRGLPATHLEHPDPTTLPTWTDPPSQFDATHMDNGYFYYQTREPQYADDDTGYEMWKSDNNFMNQKKNAYFTYEVKRAWVYLFHSIPMKEQGKIQLDVGYNTNYSTFNYVWLWQQIRRVTTGDGMQANSLLINRFIRLRMTNNDFFGMCREFNDMFKELESRKLPASDLLNLIKDTTFIMACSAPGNTILKPQLEEIFKSTQWPDAIVTMSSFANLINTQEKFTNAYDGDGVVKTFMTKTSKPKNQQGDGKSTMTCYNCGRQGHGANECRQPDSNCATCGKRHLTSMHDKATKPRDSAKDSSKDKKTGKSKGSDKQRPKQVVANQASVKRNNPNRFNALEDEEEPQNFFAFMTKAAVDDDEDMPQLQLKGTDSDSEDEEERAPSRSFVSKVSKVEPPPPSVSDPETVDDGIIPAYLDSGAAHHIFHPQDRFNSMFSHITVCRGIMVETAQAGGDGVVPVEYTGRHYLLGHVHFAPLRSRLISIRKLIAKGQDKPFHMRGKNGALTIWDSDGIEVFNSVPDGYGLFPVELHPPEPTATTIKAAVGTLVTASPNIERPYSALEIQRAKEVIQLHTANGHPNMESLGEALDNGAWPNINLTSRDIKNAEKLFGPCAACAEGKMTNPSEPGSEEVRAYNPGEVLYFDLLKTYSKCLGGYTQALICRDYVTSYITVSGLTDKSTMKIAEAISSIVTFYHSYGHTVKVCVFDHEATFVALENKIPGVRTQYTPAGLKNKRVERAIREIKEKDRSTRASLPYELPAELEVECWSAVAESINATPNSTSSPNHTPFQLVTGLRPTPRPIPFGMPVIANARSHRDPEQRAAWALYITQAYRGDHLVYLPSHKMIVSRRKVVQQSSYPEDWRFIRRPRLLPAGPVASIADIPPAAVVTHSAPATASDLPTNQTQMMLPNPNTSIGDHPAYLPTQPTTAPGQVTSGVQLADTRAVLPPPAMPIFNQSAAPVQPEAAASGNSNSVTTVRSTLPVNPVPAARLPPPPPAAVETSQPRYNLRSAEDRKKPDRYAAHVAMLSVYAYRTSLRAGLRDPDPERQSAAKNAMADELTQLIDTGTFDPKKYASLTADQKGRVIPSHMFLKDKYKADGSLDKIKARLVAGGNYVDTSNYGDISSFTVNPINVMLLLNLAAMADRRIMTIDVKGAFLIPELTDSPSDLTYVTIDPMLSNEIINIKPEWAASRNPNGTFTMQLKKTLYGLGISSNRWMTHLNNSLTQLGFTSAPGDKCLFTRGGGDSRIWLCTHVDDILTVGTPAGLDKFEKEFCAIYQCNVQKGWKHSYLALDIVQHSTTYQVSVGQSGYRRDVLNRFAHLMQGVRNDGRVPSGPEIIQPETDDSPPADRSLYASIVMSVMFLSRFTRIDLSFTTNILTTHIAHPTEHHMKHAIRLLKYLAHVSDMVIVYKSSDPNPVIYADASHATHADGKGHGCIMIFIGTGIIYCKSYKLRLTTLSSTESEYVVMCDASTLAEWFMSILRFMRIKAERIDVAQDNTSTISWTEGDMTFARNKHLMIRRNKAKEAVVSGLIRVIHVPTERMLADLGTKPLPLRQLLSHMSNAGMMCLDRDGDGYRLRRIDIPLRRRDRE